MKDGERKNKKEGERERRREGERRHGLYTHCFLFCDYPLCQSHGHLKRQKNTFSDQNTFSDLALGGAIGTFADLHTEQNKHHQKKFMKIQLDRYVGQICHAFFILCEDHSVRDILEVDVHAGFLLTC